MTRPLEILLVDDSAGDVRLTRESLAEAKVANHLAVVHDGEQALAYLRRQGAFARAPHPDLVLLDLNLPRKDGREVLAEIKADTVLRRLPVVVLTTSHDEADVLAACGLQANCFLVKPVDTNQFLAVVATIGDFWLSVVKRPTEPLA